MPATPSAAIDLFSSDFNVIVPTQLSIS
jgi:hypothetical protein